MATDPKEHPLHQVPDKLPRPPGDLPPSEQAPEPARVPAPPAGGTAGPEPYSGEKEDEAGDPVGKPPRL